MLLLAHQLPLLQTASMSITQVITTAIAACSTATTVRLDTIAIHAFPDTTSTRLFSHATSAQQTVQVVINTRQQSAQPAKMAIPYHLPLLAMKLHVVSQIACTVHLLESAANATNGIFGMEATVWKEQAYCARMEQKDTFQTNATITVQVTHMR